MSTPAELLAAVPAKYATPDPSTLAKLPKPTKKENPKGKCDVCGGFHGLPAIHIDYQGHADVTLSLIEVDPCWSWRPVAFDGDGAPLITVQGGGRLVMWGYLTVHGVDRICVGTCETSKPDPEKELIGDLLRNGAMRFGIATRLWSKADSADPAGTSQSGGYGTTSPAKPRQRPTQAPQDARQSTPTGGPKATEKQIQKMAILFRELGVTDRTEKLEMIARYAREVDTSKDLAPDEAGKVIDALELMVEARKRGVA